MKISQSIEAMAHHAMDEVKEGAHRISEGLHLGTHRNQAQGHNPMKDIKDALRQGIEDPLKNALNLGPAKHGHHGHHGHHGVKKDEI